MDEQQRQTVASDDNIQIRHEWCKACGICIAFCPKQVLGADEDGKVTVVNADACIRCRLCELRCPDFAIYLRSEQHG